MADYPNKTNGNKQNGNHSDKTNNENQLPLINITEETSSKSPSDGNNGNFNRKPHQIESSEWNLGWTDGRYGQPKMTYIDTIEAEAQFQEEDEKTSIQQDIAKDKAKIILLSERIAQLKSQIVNLTRQFEKISVNRTNDRQEYSTKLAWIYLIFAMGLFIADIPLTINLVASGFGLSPPNAAKITFETFSSVEGVMQFVIDYWGVVMLAMGLIMSGLFVKVFLDKVVLCEPEERPNSLLTKIFMTTALLVTMVLYLFTFTYLGFYREDQLRLTETAKIKKDVEDDFKNRVIIFGKAKNEEDRKALESQKDDTVKKRIQEYEDGKSKFASIVFIALTILFPIVGGLCFSIGSRKYYKSKLYAELKNELKTANNDFEAAITEKEEAEDDLHQKEELLEKRKTSDVDRKRFIELRKNVYSHGYERGSKMMQTLNEGEGLYDRCESLILTKLAEKARNTIWKETYEKNNDE